MHELHPNEYVYFNRIAGGLPGASGRYDTDYYGNSYKEAFARLVDHLWMHDRQTFSNNVYVVSGCIPDFVAEQYLPANFRWREPGGPPAQFYFGYTRGDCHLHQPGRPAIVEVQRQGVTLVVVRDLRNAQPRQERPVP
jgi:hypothetical protein